MLHANGLLDLTIIIPSYNTRAVLQNCIESIYQHTKGISFEIICIDDASPDDSADMVAQCFPQVILVRNEVNQFYARNNNLGMRMSRARYACLLNSDTLLVNDAFAALVRFMDEHPEVAACSPKLLNPDRTVQHSIRGFVGPAIFFLQTLNWHKMFPASRAMNRYYNTTFDYAKTQPVDSIGTTAYVLRRSTWECAGMLDERLGQHIVDLAYNYTLRQKGLKVYYAPCAEVIHFGSQSINQKALPAHRAQCESLVKFSEYYNYFGKSRLVKTVVRFAIWTRYYSKVLGYYFSSDKRVVKGPGAPKKEQAA